MKNQRVSVISFIFLETKGRFLSCLKNDCSVFQDCIRKSIPVVALIVASLLYSHPSTAQIVDWDEAGNGSAFNDDNSVGGTGTNGNPSTGAVNNINDISDSVQVDVSWTEVGTLSSILYGDDFVTWQNPNGGGSATGAFGDNTNGYIAVGWDNNRDNPNDGIATTFSFSEGLYGVEFTVYDIDEDEDATPAPGPWDDIIEVSLNGGAVIVAQDPSLYTLGSCVSISNETTPFGVGNAFEGTSTVGTDDAANGCPTPGLNTVGGSPNGNIDFALGNILVNSFTVDYRTNNDIGDSAVSNDTNPAAQRTGMSDIAWPVINGHVYLDSDSSGSQNGIEPDLANVDLFLCSTPVASSPCDPSDPEYLRTVTTDANGDWVGNTTSGNVQAVIDTNTLPQNVNPAPIEGSLVSTSSAIVGANTFSENDGFALGAPGPEGICYGVAENSQEFFSIDSATGIASEIGNNSVGVPNVEAIAFGFDPVSGDLVLYAADADDFGFIDLNTGIYTSIGPFGSTPGGLQFNDVDSLSYDVTTGTMWGVERNTVGSVGDAEEYLFQINLSTGAYIPGTEVAVDSLVTPGGTLTDVDDLAIDPTDGIFYASMNNGGADYLAIIDPLTGVTTAVGTGFTVNEIEGLAFNTDGELFGSTGLNSELYSIDKATGIATFIGDIAEPPSKTFSDVEALACLIEPDIQIEKTVYLGHDSGAMCAGGELAVGENGDPVTYCFEVTNTGGTYLDAITVTDSTLTPAIDRTDMTLLSGTEPLAPGASLVFYYDDTIDGDLTNTADTSGNPTDSMGTDFPGLTDPTDDDTAAVDEIAPAIELLKTVYAGNNAGASCPGVELVTGVNGDAVTYCFTVNNTGDTYLNNVVINDATLGIDQTAMTLVSGTQPLAPGASLVFYYDSTITGDLINMADTSGNPTEMDGTDLPGVEDPTDDDTAEVAEEAPAINIEKTVYLGNDAGASCAGSELAVGANGAAITYCFEVMNTGTTYLDAITVNDSTLTPAITRADMTLLSGTEPLAPGASLVFYYDDTIDGDLTNMADTSGNPTEMDGTDIPGLTDPTDDDTAAVDEVAPAIELLKTVYAGNDAGASCPGVELVTGANGDAVTYCFVVNNTGDTYLNNVGIDDATLGIDETAMTLLSGTQPLAPGASLVYYYDSTITGDLTNMADTSGNPTEMDGTDIPGLTDPTDDDTAAVDEVAPAIELLKTVYAGNDAGASCPGVELVTGANGDAVTYCFVVNNTGDTYLNNVGIDDATLGIDETAMTLLSGTQPLAPGASLVFYYDDTIDGDLTNMADTSGNPTEMDGTDIPGLTDPTDDDTAAVDEVAPAIELLKTVYAGNDAGASCPGVELVTGANGDAVTYCFVVNNTGDTYLNNVGIDDATLGIDETAMTLLSGTQPLAPGASLVYYYDSTITGDLTNMADTSGNPTEMDGTDIPGLTDPTDDDTAAVDEVAPAIELLKTVYAGNDAGASCPGVELVTGANGDAVTYCFVVNNTGDTYLNNVGIDDATLGIDETAMTLLSGTQPLAPGASLVFYYDDTIDGDLTNMADTSGNPTEMDGTDIPGLTDPTDDDTAAVDEVAPAIELLKTVYAGNDAGASCPGVELVTGANGDAVTYCFVVNNTGDTYLNNVGIDDATLGIDETAMTLLSGTQPLAPGASLVYYYDSTITGDLTNMADTSGNPTEMDGTDIPGLTDPTDDDTAAVDEVAPAIELLKTVYAGNDAGASCPGVELVTGANGDAVTYCFVVNNTGDTYLNNVGIDDATLGIDETAMTLLSGTQPLAPGASLVYYYDSTITGDLTNMADTSGNPTEMDGTDIPGLTDPTDDDTAAVDEVAPAIELLKTVYAGNDAGASCPGVELVTGANGDAVTYCFVVNNTGDTYLNNVGIDDATLGIDETAMTLLSGTQPLAPGASLVYYYDSTITGDLTNMADTSGNPTEMDGTDIPGLTDPTDDDTAAVDEVAPAIELLKTVYAGNDAGASCPGVELVTGANGDAVTYCFVVNNTGDTYLNNVGIDDATLGIDETAMTLLSGTQPLAPGASLVYYYDSTITGDLTNMADTSGNPTEMDGTDIPGLTDPTDDDTAAVDEVAPAIELLKTVYAGNDAGASCPGVELVTGANGDAVTYCFVVNNTGDTYLNNVGIDDATLGIDETAMTLLSGTQPLAPGASLVYYYDSTITGDLTNMADTSGNPTEMDGTDIPGLTDPTDDDTAAVDEVAPAIELLKTVYAGNDAGASCPGVELVTGANGDAVTYCFVVNNTGDTYLNNVGIDDATLGIDETAMTLLSGTQPLAPGASLVYYYDSTITGDLTNMADTSGNPTEMDGTDIPGLTDPTDDDTAAVDEVAPAIELLKTVYAGNDAGASCPGVELVTGANGDAVTYCFVVNNTGDTYLNNVGIDDATLGIDETAMTLLSGTQPLAPGASLVYYYDSTITGDLTNMADTSGNPTEMDGTDIPGLTDPTDDDTAAVDEVAPAIELLKTVYAGNDAGASCPGVELVTGANGDAVTYCFVVNNTGDTYLNNVGIDDATLGIDETAMTLLSGTQPLAPGASLVYYYDSTITGDLTNMADTSGNPTEMDGTDIPGLTDPTDDDTAAVDEVAPAIELLKTVYAGNDAGASCPGVELVTGANGDAVTYCFVVNNTGDTYLNNVGIDDATLGIDETAMTLLSGTQPLAPGASLVYYYDSTITGDLTNMADTSGNPTEMDGTDIPGLTDPTDDDTAAVDEVAPAIELLKTVYAGNDAGASCPGVELVTGANGDAVTYCFVVNNTGDTYLNNVGIDDATLGIDETAMTLLSGTQPLAPGASLVYYYDSTITGDLTNMADTSGNPTEMDGTDIPGLTDPTDDDTAAVDEVAPAIELLKTVYAGNDAGASCPGVELVTGANGDAVTYCFVVNNTGDTYLNNVGIDDATLGIDETAMTLLSGTQPLAPGASLVYYYDSTITGDLTNMADTSGNPTEMDGTDIPGLTDPTDDDTAAVDEVAPAIELLKTVYAGNDAGASCPGVELVTGANGDAVTYCFVVNNTGDTYLNNVGIDDATLGIDETAMTLLSGTQPLAPGASLVYYYDSTITGDLTNMADTSGNPTEMDGTDIPGLTDPTDDDTAAVDEVAPAIELLKTVYAGNDAGASCPGVELVTGANGDAVTYCFVVNNTGDTYLNNVGIDDATLGIDETAMTLLSGTQPLAPGASLVYYYDSTITGDLTNMADTSGNPTEMDGTDIPGLTDPTDDDTAAVDEVAPAIELLKTVYAGNDAGASCPGVELVTGANGDAVTYCFVVNNTGDTYLNNVGIDDATLGIDETAMTLLSGTQPLAPGASLVYYYDSTITGDLTNMADTSGNPTEMDGTDIPGLTDPTDDDTAAVDEVAPAIELLKTVYAGNDAGASCPGVELVTGANGDAVTYCFVVNNTGDTYLNNVGIDDATLGIDETAMTLLSGTQPLAPGASLVYYYDSTITGDLTNMADTSGNPTEMDGTDIPGLTDPTDDDTAAVDEVAPAIELLKTVYAGNDAGASCPGVELVTGANGDAVTYCFVVNNTGDTYLNNVGIDDATLGIDETAMTLLSGTQPLAPGASLVYYYDSTITGDLTNMADTSGNPTEMDGTDIPGLTDPTDDDTAAVDEVAPAIELLKTVYAGNDAGASCPGVELVTGANGDAVTYCFVVNNTGDTYLNNVGIDDATLGIDETAMTLLSGTQPLAPGASLVYYYDSTITGDLTNMADTSGNPTEMDGTDIPGLTDPTDDDTAAVDEVAPGIEIQKTVYLGNDAGASCAGSELATGANGAAITYCFEVMNTGTTYLDAITVNDSTLTPAITRADMTLLSGTEPLAPGASLVFYYDDTIDGDLTNMADTSGNPTEMDGTDIPGLTDPTDDDTAAVDEVAPGIEIQKTVYLGNDAGASCAGSELAVGANGAAITYCFEVMNTGTTYLDAITVNDSTLTPAITRADMTLLSGTEPLAPGASLVFYYDDTIDGDLTNMADTSGNPTEMDGTDIPGLTDPTDDDTAAVDEVAPGIEVQKTVYLGNDAGASCAGSELAVGANGAAITYCFEVMNTGTTYLDAITVNDSTLTPAITRADMTLLSGTEPLAPGASLVFYYDDTIDGDLTNMADTSGNPTEMDGTDIPGLTDPTDDDTAAVDEVAPGIEVQKTVYLGNDAGASCAGSELAVGANGAAITYCFEVMNTGTTYLDAITVNDSTLTPAITRADMTLLSGTEPLAPGASLVFYYDDTIDGDLTNMADTSGNPTEMDGTDIPGLTDPTDDDTAAVDEVAPGIEIQKTVYLGNDAGASCAGSELAVGANGAAITYCFEVMNTGTTYLDAITVNDSTLTPAITRADMTLLSGTEPLAPGASLVFYYDDTIDGDLTNMADTSGNPTEMDGTDIPGLTDPTDDDTAAVDEVAPGIEVQKTVYLGNDAGASCAGSELAVGANGAAITYCFEVMNTGTTYLDAITVNDSTLTPAITRADMTLLSGTEPLAPGASLVFYYDDTIDGDLTNMADTSGNPTEMDGTDIPGLTDPTDDDTAAVDEVNLSLGSVVWEDSNSDGMQDPTEPPLEGATVVLIDTATGLPAIDAAGNPVAPITVGPDGLYEFTDLLPGDYVVQVTPPAGYYPSPIQNAADDDVENDSNIDTSVVVAPGTYQSGTITLTSDGEPQETDALRGDNQDGAAGSSADLNGNMTVDFGFVPSASIGDYVWLDFDMDGVQDANEDPIPNVTVNLYQDTTGDGNPDTLVATAITGPNGEYLFPDLEPGVAYLTEVDPSTLPPGLTQTFDEGVGGLDNTSDPIILDPGEAHLTADFGYAPPIGSLGDTIWIDANDDGVQDPGEQGIPGVTVILTPPFDVDLGAGLGVPITTMTDANGKYLFAGLPLDETYLITVDTTTLPTGYVSGPSNLGDPDVRDGFSTVADNTTTVTLTTTDPVNLDADFGYLPPDEENNTIGDTIWLDVNGDGVIDATENGIPNVTVVLLDDMGTPIATSTTDANGMYEFTGVPDGDYTVVVTDQGNVLAGLDQTYDDDDATGPFTTPNQSEVIGLGVGDPNPVSNLDQDFGYNDPVTAGIGTIGDTIFGDEDADGVQDPNESGFQGVEVLLYGAGPDGIIGTPDDVLLQTTTTDANGNYLFTGLDTSPGAGTPYQVVVDTTTLPGDPAAWTNTADPDGTFDSVSTTNLTDAAPDDLDQDFGYQSLAMNRISGTIWADDDGDGTLVEPDRFEGVTVILLDENGNQIAETETDANGNYEFSGLPDGIYQVIVTDDDNVLNGYEHTDSPNGPQSPNDGESKDDTGYFVDLDSGGLDPNPVEDTTGDFGYEPSITTPISLGSFSAVEVGGNVQIDWVTQTEVANLGFNLYAQIGGSWVVLNDSGLILSQGDSVSIQSYSMLFDVDAQAFALGDVDLEGVETLHGPFLLNQSYGEVSERQTIDWTGEKLERDLKEAQREAQRLEQQRQRNEQRRIRRQQSQQSSQLFDVQNPQESIMSEQVHSQSWLSRAAALLVAAVIPTAHAVDIYAEDIVNLSTTTAGIHTVSYADLLAYGIDLSEEPVSRFAVMNKGDSVPTQVIGSDLDGSVFGPGASVRFIAEQIDTLYTGTNVYTLRLDSDEYSPMDVYANPVPSGASANAYLAKARFAPQSSYSFASPDQEDPWYASRIVAVGTTPASDTVQLNLEGYAPGGNSGSTKAKLKVNLWGASSLAGVADDHRVKVQFNNTPVITDTFDGITKKELNVSLDSVKAGNNNVKLTLPMDTGYAYDAVNVDEVEVSYPRQFIAKEDRLDFSSTFTKFTLSGFNGTSASEFVVMREDANGTFLHATMNKACRGSCSLQFGGTGELAHYYTSAVDALYEPTLEAMPLEQDITSANAAYLVISHPDFIGTGLLEDLLSDLVVEHGSAKIVDVEAIYAQFGNHLFDPAAIQTYIQDSVANRGTQYVLLVGGDVYDYRQFENEDATSFIPSIYASTGSNINFAPVDAKYVDLDDDDVPDLPIGRLPVRTTQQLSSLLSKRDSYNARTYGGKILLIADEFDELQDYDFDEDAEEVHADYLSGFDVDKVYVDEYFAAGQTIGQARASVVDAINAGQSLTAFFGHSSTNQWAFNGLFTGNDAASLNNIGRPTVVTQWGCWNAYYVSPNEDSMGHRFMMEGDQGAVAVMGATTLTDANSERKLARMVFERIGNGERIGDAVTNAKQEYALTNPNDLDVLLGWTLLGLPDMLVN